MHKNRNRRMFQWMVEAPPAPGGGTPQTPPAAPPAPTPADVAAAAAASGQAGAIPGQQAAAPTPGTPPAPSASGDSDLDNLSQTDLVKIVRELRRENGSARTNAKAAAAEEAKKELAKEIGKALGIVSDDTPPDPAALTAQAQAAAEAARQSALQLAVFKAAAGAQADPNALLDSNTFLASVKDIDPTDGAAITAAIKAAVQNNSRLSAAPVAGASTVDVGGTGTPQPTSLDGAIAKHYGA